MLHLTLFALFPPPQHMMLMSLFFSVPGPCFQKISDAQNTGIVTVATVSRLYTAERLQLPVLPPLVFQLPQYPNVSVMTDQMVSIQLLDRVLGIRKRVDGSFPKSLDALQMYAGKKRKAEDSLLS